MKKKKPKTKAQIYYARKKKIRDDLEKEAKVLWEQRVREKWGNKCACGCGREAHTTHHFFAKGAFKILKYDVDNGCPIALGDHIAHHRKGDPTVHQRIIERRGQDWYDALLEKSKQHFVNNEYWIREQIERLKNSSNL